MTLPLKPVDVKVTSDFICPWCWIGHRRLCAGIELAALKSKPLVQYVPYEINPQMPLEGISRRQYRSAKFGSWARSQAMDLEVALAGPSLGLTFNFDQVTLTPNTRLAHRLMFMAQSEGDTVKTETLLESIFSAYFTEGRDIGSLDVLVDLAVAKGFDSAATRNYLLGSAGDIEVAATVTRAIAEGIRSLPTLRIDGTQVSGAQPATVLAEALRSAEAKNACEAKRE